MDTTNSTGRLRRTIASAIIATALVVATGFAVSAAAQSEDTYAPGGGSARVAHLIR